MVKLSKSAYRAAIEQDLKLLFLHMPRGLEREHIETVLNWSVNELYPEDPTVDLTGTVTGVTKTKATIASDKFKIWTYIYDGRQICSFFHGRRHGLMICTRDPHNDGPCAMQYLDALTSRLEIDNE